MAHAQSAEQKKTLHGIILSDDTWLRQGYPLYKDSINLYFRRTAYGDTIFKVAIADVKNLLTPAKTIDLNLEEAYAYETRANRTGQIIEMIGAGFLATGAGILLGASLKQYDPPQIKIDRFGRVDTASVEALADYDTTFWKTKKTLGIAGFSFIAGSGLTAMVGMSIKLGGRSKLQRIRDAEHAVPYVLRKP